MFGKIGNPFRSFRRPPASLLLLVLGIVILVGAAVQAVRTSRSQQRTVTRVLQNYAAVAAWNFEQQARPVFQNGAEPLFHPLHEVSFASGAVSPYSIRVLLQNELPAMEGCPCSPLRAATRYGVRVPLRSASVETSAPVAEPVLESLVHELRAHFRRTPEPQRLTTMEAMHAFVLADTGVVVMYSWKRVPQDTLLYALVMDPRLLAPLFERVLAEGPLLPEPLLAGVANTDLLAASIELPGGGPLVHGTPVDGPLVSERTLSALGNLVMRVQILDDAEQHLILGGSPGLGAPVLLALLALALGLLLVAFSQMRREYALARLRADFVSSVSHELRTPLALQRIFLDMLRLRRVDTPERRAWCLDNIERESIRLAHLVENVLHFSRAERGGLRIHSEPALLAPVVADILRAFEPLARTSSATIAADLAPDVTAPVDAAALRQVLMNVLENAVKYGPSGQRIRVRLELVSGVARLSVQDEGPGVPPSEREAVFEPYRRGTSTLNTSVTGSGIGLAVVRGLVHGHGGRVFIEDAAGGGARVVIELPNARREAVSAPASAPEGAPVAT